jgi:hypothetical protein
MLLQRSIPINDLANLCSNLSAPVSLSGCTFSLHRLRTFILPGPQAHHAKGDKLCQSLDAASEFEVSSHGARSCLYAPNGWTTPGVMITIFRYPNWGDGE